MVKVNRKEFFVINVTNRNVVLGDLYTTIPAHATVNFLSKHYDYTLEELIESAMTGSLYRKSNMIWLRNGELKKEIAKIQLENTILPNRAKSTNVIEQVVYEELMDISDDEYLEDHLSEDK